MSKKSKKKAAGIAPAPRTQRNAVPSPPDEGNPHKLPLYRRVLFLLVPFLLFALLLAGVEGGTRLMMEPISNIDQFIKVDEQRNDLTHDGVTIFQGDPLLGWSLRPNLRDFIWDYTLVSTNAQGFRHDRPIGHKPKGAFRIVCVGDSVTFGYRVPVVWPARPNEADPNAKPYPAEMERQLRLKYGRDDIEVIALAAPGYTSAQGLAWLKRDIGWLAPDIVTVCFGWNDTNPSTVPDTKSLPTGGPRLWGRKMMAHSQVFAHFAHWLNGKNWWAKLNREDPPGESSPAEDIPRRVSKDEYVRNILDIASLAQKHDARVLVLGPVFRDKIHAERTLPITQYRDELRKVTQEKGIAYLEFPQLMENNYPTNEMLFGEAIHPSHIGHRLMTRDILMRMNQEGWFKGLE